MSVGIIGRPVCKQVLCVAVFMPIRLCDEVTADKTASAGIRGWHDGVLGKKRKEEKVLEMNSDVTLL